MRMLGQEPPQPKLWKAILGAATIVFPMLYVVDAGFLHHRPGFYYVLVAIALSLLLGYQMYANGPESLRPFDFRRGVGGVNRDAARLVPRRKKSERD
ncbi:MAG TPA: hypothetical protein VFH72_03650 [Candidatus Baltobacteraceae bacterium]|jgi:hypothetical protein|nr:hypothetical protein [Candidatus Baltobacteraceae bacterium]